MVDGTFDNLTVNGLLTANGNVVGAGTLTVNSYVSAAGGTASGPGFWFNSVGPAGYFSTSLGIGLNSSWQMVLNSGSGGIVTAFAGTKHNTLDDSSGNMTVAGNCHANTVSLAGNPITYLRNDNGYLRQCSGYGFVAEGTVTVGTYAAGGAGSAVYFNAYHQLCQGTSLREYKTNIEQLSDASWIFNLRPVMFDWKNDEEAKAFGRQIGFIAEEVQQYAPLLTFNDDQTGQLRGVSYEKLAVPMLVELKKLRQEVDELKTKLPAA